MMHRTRFQLANRFARCSRPRRPARRGWRLGASSRRRSVFPKPWRHAMASVLQRAAVLGALPLLGWACRLGEEVDLMVSPPWSYGENSKNTGTKTRRCRLPLGACGAGCVASRPVDYARRSSRHSFASTWRRSSIISRGRKPRSIPGELRLC